MADEKDIKEPTTNPTEDKTEDVLSVIKETYEKKITEMQAQHAKEVETLNKKYEDQEQRHIRQIKEILMTGKTETIETTSPPKDEKEQAINNLLNKYKRRF